MYVSAPFRGTAATNKVLRNTFILLALTLLPTIGGVLLGMELGLPELMRESPWLSLGAFLIVAFGMLFAISAFSSSALAIPLVLAFTGLMGLNLSGLISVALGAANGASIIGLAFLGTVGILIGCGTYAATTKRDFSGMKGFLFGALIAVIVVGLSNMFFQAGWLALLLAAVTLVLFSAFLIYDVQQVVNGGETNYVLATVAIYLDLLNIFSSLLQLLLSIFGSDD